MSDISPELASVFVANREKVRRVLVRLVGELEADDLTQEVFVRVAETPARSIHRLAEQRTKSEYDSRGSSRDSAVVSAGGARRGYLGGPATEQSRFLRGNSGPVERGVLLCLPGVVIVDFREISEAS